MARTALRITSNINKQSTYYFKERMVDRTISGQFVEENVFSNNFYKTPGSSNTLQQKLFSTSSKEGIRQYNQDQGCERSSKLTKEEKQAKIQLEKTPTGKLESQEDGVKHPYQEKEPLAPHPGGVNQETGEIGGPKGPEPTRYGDWERKGRVTDF